MVFKIRACKILASSFLGSKSITFYIEVTASDISPRAIFPLAFNKYPVIKPGIYFNIVSNNFVPFPTYWFPYCFPSNISFIPTQLK